MAAQSVRFVQLLKQSVIVYPVGYPGLLVIAVTSGIPYPVMRMFPLNALATLLTCPVIQLQSPSTSCKLKYEPEQLRQVLLSDVTLVKLLTAGKELVLPEHPYQVLASVLI